MTTDATQAKPDGGLLVTADTTIAELEEACVYLAQRARRLPNYFPEYARIHDRINTLLTYRECLNAFTRP